MTTNDIRKRFIDFFEKRGHSILPSASLVTSDEKGVTNSTLFNTAGMQPLVPFLMGQPHPRGTRLASAQKCIRTVDIDEVGDNTHATFFEMLGNWSLGDYFKEEAIAWSYEFLTSKTEGLGLDPKRLYITIFAGNDDAPLDQEAIEIWKKFIPENRIYKLSGNWWAAGDNGPCGPDTEMFYDLTGELGDLTHEGFIKADDEQKIVEIWNDVFMVYEKKDGKVIGELPNRNVDTGSGLERLSAVLQQKNNIFETDVFSPIIEKINEISNQSDDTRSKRIIADHIKTSAFLIADGVTPSNTDRGYILRRLIRRAIRVANKINISEFSILELLPVIEKIYIEVYPEIQSNSELIKNTLEKEETAFRKTLSEGLKQFEKISKNGEINSQDAFKLFTTYGFPIELTLEIAKEKSIKINVDEFNDEFKKHQDISRSGAEGKFKGGLASHGEMETKYHTATHLLHTALKKVLGDHVEQKGSNITAERLRFDFSHPDKMTDEQKIEVEKLVNDQIQSSLDVIQKDMPLTEAKSLGAIGLFGDKYGEIVSTYTIGDSENPFSRELCGGPHVKNTNELGKFVIKKEEASSAGIRRIKAILE